MNIDYSALVPKVVGMVNEGKLPRRLFHYKPFDEKGYTLDILRKCEIFFATPALFNDPFDCQVTPHGVTQGEAFLHLATSPHSAAVSPADLKHAISATPDIDATVRKAFHKILNNLGVRCFTPHDDNMLMWSHYSNSHSGVCLEFDVLEDPAFFTVPVRVTYQEKYPEIDFTSIDTMRRDIHHAYATKSRDWEYENEYRVIKTKPGAYPFKPAALRSVIFGCKADDKNIEAVKNIIATRPDLSHVKLRQAAPAPNEYRLIISDL